jgi:hypothetical protein
MAGHSLTEQTARLQQVLVAGYTHILYHIHPNDSVATAALAAAPRPQVVVVNHSDHTFWLGAAAGDIVAAVREWSVDVSLTSRLAQRVALLPIPVNFPPFDLAEKAAARKQLNIPDDQVMLLSVASAFKFNPSKKYNYFRLIQRVLEQNPHVVAKVVGVSREEASASTEMHERFDFLGTVEKPDVYYKAADIYVDSMPFSSFTSLFEAMYFGCYPVLQFDPASTLELVREVVLKGLVEHARDEDEEIRFIEYAVNNPDYRRKIAQRASQLVKDNYMGAGWKGYLDKLYAMSEAPVAVPRIIHKLANAAPTVNDEDAAVLSRALFGNAVNFMLFCLTNRTKQFSFLDVLHLYRVLQQNPSSSQRLTMRQVLYFAKVKWKKGLAGG